MRLVSAKGEAASVHELHTFLEPFQAGTFGQSRQDVHIERLGIFDIENTFLKLQVDIRKYIIQVAS